MASTTTTAKPEEIRHAGKALIRGRIRRVWRPRYLELMDSGHLRYYDDLHPTTHAVHAHAQAAARNLKYTLTVHAARILDVTTIRDLHVGLPRGAFGFLVRGQRILPNNNNNNANNTNNSSSSRNTDQYQLPSPTCGFLEYTSPSTTMDATLAAFLLADATSLDEQPVRDYLCAVETLEEAQMWVVALQWAASLQPPAAEQWWKVDVKTPPASSPSSALPEPQPLQQHQAKAKSDSTAASKHKTEATVAKRDTSKAATSDADVTTATTALNQPQPSSPSINESSPPKEGKILVTKAVRYAVVRLSAWWELEIAYDVECLLIHSSNNNNHQDVVEQWSIRRTAADLRAFVAQLPDADQRRNTAHVVDRLPRWSRRPSAAQVAQSLSVVDSLLRSWVLSADLVNTAAFQALLGLSSLSSSPAATAPSSSSSNTNNNHSWWQIHDPRVILSRAQKTVPPRLNHDQYVKQWLQKSAAAARRSTASPVPQQQTLHSHMVQFRHDQRKHMLWMGGAVAAAAAAPWVSRIWLRIVPVLTIRLDYLVVSWMGASYLGHRIGLRVSSSSANNSVDGSKKESHRGGGGGSSGTRAAKAASTPTRRATPAKKSRTPTKLISHTPATPSVNAKENGDVNESHDDSAVMVHDETANVVLGDDMDFDDFRSTASREPDESDGDDYDDDDDDASGVSADELATSMEINDDLLSSPLPKYPDNQGTSCWSQPSDNIFHVRGANYLNDKIKVASGPAPLKCSGVDVWLTDDPVRHIARHPAVMGGRLGKEDTFLVNFLLPFGNFVAYFSIPPLDAFPDKLRTVWTKFLKGDQEYRDARLKLLPYVVEGPWIVKTAVGPGKSPALLGKVIPLQYFFREAESKQKAVYEVDVLISASAIAKGILSVVKSQTKALTIGFAFIIEAAEQSELPETVLCSFQVHSLHLEDCPVLPECSLDGV